MQSRVAPPAKQTGQLSLNSAVRQWSGPSNITTFVRCLRLLDLDRLADWPGITEDLFTSRTAQQNLQARIKAVEWSLYRLFEIYDFKETQMKLRPFFPPLAPLQSLNLRAALYRALTELKKAGVLGKDIVLRKTMLDECKGEKFEEVISTIALVVLRNACRLRHPTLMEQIDQTPSERLIPLIIVYRKSLQQSLQQRQTISQRAEASSARLETAQIDLQKRIGEAQEGFQEVDEKDLRQLSDFVRGSWVGDDQLSDILLGGRSHSVSAVPQMSFETTWSRSAEYESTPAAESNKLAAELDERIREQGNRLKEWKTFYASMKNIREGRPQASKRDGLARDRSLFEFDQHKELRLNSLHKLQTATKRLQPCHASVLRDMYEELSGGTPDINSSEITGNQEQPMVSSSAHEDISATSASATWCELSLNTETSNEIQKLRTEAVGTADVGELYTSPIGKGSDIHLETTDMPSSPPTGHGTFDGVAPDLALVQEEKAVALPGSKRNSLATLHERTRASLLPFTLRLRSPDVQDDPVADDESDTSQILPPLPEIMAPRSTLQDRTRQSMALLPNPPPISKGPRQSLTKQPSFSEIFPVNQFETPGRAQEKQSGAWSPRSGSSTPRDKLFSDEADYASVFKSRPRIAVSPSLSPERSNLGLDSKLADAIDDLELEDNDKSPSRGPMRH